MDYNKTTEYLLKRFNLKNPEPVIKLRGHSRWGTLTRLFRELDFKVGVEVGAERCRFSKIICQVNPQLKLYAVDCWEGYPGYREHVHQTQLDRFFKESRTRMERFNCQLIRAYSMDAVRWFDDESVDFVFIDANHDYEYVKEDIREWSKKVKKGGLVCGHDYVNGIHGQVFGVKPALNEWVEKNKIKPLFLLKKDGCPSWFYVKK